MKRDLQILDEMNLLDTANGTKTVQISYSKVGAETARGGAHVTMGVPINLLVPIAEDEVYVMLVVVDKKEFNRLKPM